MNANTTERPANFPTEEEGRAMPGEQQNAPVAHHPAQPTKQNKTQIEATKPVGTVIEQTHTAQAAQKHANQSAGTKATRNRVNRSGQVRRKAKSGLSNNR
jgi:hypothetical protein